MSAIRRGKIYARERVDLGEVIPLEVPFSVQIDICSACNLKCNFCFHSDLNAIKRAGISFGFMSYGLFTRIIDDMKSCWGEKKIKKLRLFKVGEPLLNPDVCRMVKYAKEADVAELIEITTNGTLLSEEMNLGLIDAGLDILNISVNGINEKQYEDACGYSMQFDKFQKSIAHFYQNKRDCQVFIKYSDTGYSQEEKESFYQLFENCCDEIFVETISANLWQDTNIGDYVADAHKGIYGQALEKKQVCPFLFTTMVINDKGIVHLCCVDWKTEYILGDLKSESIADIWNGTKLKEYQRMHLSGKKDCMNLCKNCESLSANTTDNIDGYAESILKKMEG